MHGVGQERDNEILGTSCHADIIQVTASVMNRAVKLVQCITLFARDSRNKSSLECYVLQTHINFPRFLPIFPDFLERLSHLAPIY
jgi:hypothetical protein